MNLEKIPLDKKSIESLANRGIIYDTNTGHRVDGTWLPGQGADADDDDDE